MTSSTLYRLHLETLDSYLREAIERAAKHGLRLRGVLFHAGKLGYHHRDDQTQAFHSEPHFARYVPLSGPDHCVVARPGKKPVVVRVAPRDFWYEVKPIEPSYWQKEVELAEVTSLAEVRSVTGQLDDIAYVGNSPEAAVTELGIPESLCEPAALMSPLDWYRAIKTEHEQELLKLAAKRSAAGHRAARAAFLEGGASEREIHWAYLRATEHLECEVPFENIVAFDEKCATLHYQNKRGREVQANHTFMLDAGASVDGFASDITRTWVKNDWAEHDHTARFAKLLAELDVLQRDLVAMVKPGRPFLELHVEAHRRIGRALAAVGIVSCDGEEAFARGITRTFLPHGLGHHLGFQVHDIGGRQLEPDGGTRPPPSEYPFLRNTRDLAPGHVVTIEPGIYFVPMLLESLRATKAGAAVRWDVVEQLVPLGGMRIEDDVVCTNDAPRDLTRPFIGGPRDDKP